MRSALILHTVLSVWLAAVSGHAQATISLLPSSKRSAEFVLSKLRGLCLDAASVIDSCCGDCRLMPRTDFSSRPVIFSVAGPRCGHGLNRPENTRDSAAENNCTPAD